MKALDSILAVFALAGLACFLGVLIWKVPEPGLVIVCVVGIGLAGYDFFRTLAGNRRRDQRDRLESV